MNNFLTLTFIFLSFMAFSQSDIEIGLEWSYSQPTPFGQINPTYITITGDTIISGEIWHTMEGDGSCAFNNDKPLIRSENSKWYIYNPIEETSSLLYDFSLTKGQSYLVDFFGQNHTIEVFVDSTATISLNGTNRKIQYCSNPNSNNDGFFFGAEIIEGIGSTGYLLPQGNICDPQAGPIRCYSSNTEFVDFDTERDCDESYFLVSTNDLERHPRTKLLPNPVSTNQTFKVESELNIELIKVYNTEGAIIKTTMPDANTTELELSNPGLYYISIKSLDKVSTMKLVVTD